MTKLIVKGELVQHNDMKGDQFTAQFHHGISAVFMIQYNIESKIIAFQIWPSSLTSV